MNRCLVSVLLLLSVAFVIGCSNQPSSVRDYASLIDNLNKSPATLEPKGDLSQPPFPQSIFSGTAKLVELNGENLIVWEYKDAVTAETEAKFVSPDGFDFRKPPDSKSEGIGATVDYIAPPHWYKAGKIIVLYVGENQETIDLLETLLGQQFAGG